MIVKHIGYDGKIRCTFEGISSMHQHDGNNIITVNRKTVYIEVNAGQTANGPVPSILRDTFGWPYEYPVAIINLAPGERVERDEEPVRA
jgi:hypothetical protein